MLGARSCTTFEIAILGTAGVGGTHLTFSAIIWELSTWLMPFLRQMSQEVTLSIYTRNDLISVAIVKEKEMSQSLLTCPRNRKFWISQIDHSHG